MIETAAIYAFIIANEAIIVFAMQACIFLAMYFAALFFGYQVAKFGYKASKALIALCHTVSGYLRYVLSGLPQYDVQPNPEANVPAEPPLDLEADFLEEPEPVLPEYADKYQPEDEPPPYSGEASSINIVYTIRKKWAAYQHDKQISEIFDLPAYEDVEDNVVISPGGN